MEIPEKQRVKDVCSTCLKPCYWLWIRKGKKCFGKCNDTVETSDGHAACIGNHIVHQLKLPILLPFGGVSDTPGQEAGQADQPPSAGMHRDSVACGQPWARVAGKASVRINEASLSCWLR